MLENTGDSVDKTKISNLRKEEKRKSIYRKRVFIYGFCDRAKCFAARASRWMMLNKIITKVPFETSLKVHATRGLAWREIEKQETFIIAWFDI